MPANGRRVGTTAQVQPTKPHRGALCENSRAACERGTSRCRRTPDPGCGSRGTALRNKRGTTVSDKTTIDINVDTFSDAGGYFVRTEIEARSVNIHGPFADAQAAQKAKADQLAHLKKSSEALCEPLRRATTTLSQG